MREVDTDVFHVARARAHATPLRQNGKQQGLRLTRELDSCTGCPTTKGIHTGAGVREASITGEATAPTGVQRLGEPFVHTLSRDGSVYTMMLNDGISREREGVASQEKVGRARDDRGGNFLADMGAPPLSDSVRTTAGRFSVASAGQSSIGTGFVRRDSSPADAPMR